MPFDRIDIYAQALNTAFVSAYDAIADVAPIEVALTEVPSHGRVENYPWMFPPPMPHLWQGFRQYATLGTTNYRVPNLTWTAEFECNEEDLQDDQIDGFKRQAAAMAQGMKEWRAIESQINLANGQSVLCCDGTNFFDATHTSRTIPWGFATGGNIITGTTASSDGITHAMVALVVKNKMVKPLLWQNRQPPNFRTDAGSLQADQNRKVRWWSDLRGAPAFGFPWDAILFKWGNTPTVAEMQTGLGQINARFRSFTYPKNLDSDPNQYPHGQTKFDDKSLVVVCSSGIEHIARQALTLSLIGQTENYFKGFAELLCSGYLDAVV